MGQIHPCLPAGMVITCIQCCGAVAALFLVGAGAAPSETAPKGWLRRGGSEGVALAPKKCITCQESKKGPVFSKSLTLLVR